MMKLDEYSVGVLISKVNEKFIDNALKKENLSVKIVELIAIHGSDKHRWVLLQKHKLTPFALFRIIFWGKQRDEFISYIIQNFDDLDNFVLDIIYSDGTRDQQKKIVEKFGYKRC